MVGYLEKDFPENSGLSKEENKNFINFLCEHNIIGVGIWSEWTRVNDEIKFTNSNKEDFARKLLEYLKFFRETEQEKSGLNSKAIKALKTAAIGVTGLAIGASTLSVKITPINSETSNDVDQVHSAQAKNQQKNYPPELEKLELHDLKNLDKIREALGNNLKKDDSGKEYFEAFGRNIYLDDKEQLQKTIATIKAIADVSHKK